MCGNMDTDTGLGFPAFAFPPTHRLIPLGTLFSPQKCEAVWLHSLPPPVYPGSGSVC